jgi:hypothetical protein
VKNGFYLLAIILYLSLSQLRAQTVDSVKYPFSASVPAKPLKRNFPAAATKLMVANILPFSVNYFIRRVPFSYVSSQSIANNLQISGWEWDEDKFFNNQFSHPYHGSFYFNAFRSEGYSFSQSALATFTGSLIWEIAGERDKGAPNDLINTTFGGITWGEMSHRLAMRFTHNWRSGRRKNALDILGIALDPMSGISALVSKKRQLAQRGVFDTTAIKLELSGGGRQYGTVTDHKSEKIRGEWFTRMNFVYGAPNFGVKVPFAYFTVMLELGTSDSALLNIARIRGNLSGWNLRQSYSNSHSLLLMLNYDYYNNTAFSYGMQSVQLALNSRFQLPLKTMLQTEAGTSVIFLAAISDHELFEGKKRNYDYCSGAGLTATANLLVYQRFNIRTNLSIGWLHTHDGKNANYRVLNSIVALRCRLTKNVFLEYERGDFALTSVYTDSHENVKHNSYKRLSLGYQFRF